MTRVTALALVLIIAACGGDDAATTSTSSSSEPPLAEATDDLVTFRAEIWADNWFALSVDGELVLEDPVPITTERSFNAESVDFDASYPFTVAVITKDFEETTSGLEYIGTPRQQMGDGGFIAQITELSTGRVVAVTDSSWRQLVVNRGPLNEECVHSSDPDTDCVSEISEAPDGWDAPGFDDSEWRTAVIHTAQEVGPKDGYDEIAWDPAAELVWSQDLEVDNTILWRVVVPDPDN